MRAHTSSSRFKELDTTYYSFAVLIGDVTFFRGSANRDWLMWKFASRVEVQFHAIER